MKSNLTWKTRLLNIKLLPLLVGAVSLSLSAATVLPAFAQVNEPAAPTERSQFRKQNILNLTPEQREKMQQIRQSSQAQIDNILTAEQKAKLKAARENRENPRQVFASLNLTAQQRSQMQEIKRSSREQMDAILTPEQRQQLQQYKQQRRQARPQGTQTP